MLRDQGIRGSNEFAFGFKPKADAGAVITCPSSLAGDSEPLRGDEIGHPARRRRTGKCAGRLLPSVTVRLENPLRAVSSASNQPGAPKVPSSKTKEVFGADLLVEG